MAIDNSDRLEQAQVIKLDEGVFGRQEIDNMGWFDLGGFTVVADALEQPSAWDDVLAGIVRTIGDQPIRYVLNTHPHPDHVALNGDFARLGAEIINARTRSIPAEGLVFEGDKRAVRLIPMPGCHTNYDCVVWLPEERVLFVGDLFGWGLIPVMGNLSRQRRELLLETYRKLLEFEPKTVIPGHGPFCSAAELERWRDYFLWLINTVEKKVESGVPAEEISDSAIPPPEDMRHWWRFEEWKHQNSVRKVAKALNRNWR